MPIKITSRFTPFTYDEITKPLVQQTEAQRAMEDTYMDLSTQAAQLESLANQETDHDTYIKLKSYSDDLKAQAESLVAHGLQTGSRRALLNMRSRYANDIIPIETAIKRRSELANEQRKLRASNPDLMFQRDMGTVSLDELVSNPQLDYGKSYSGAQIQKDVSDMVTTVAGSLGSIAAGGNIDPYTKEIINKSGFTVGQIQQALASGVNGDEVLNQIAKGVLNKTGIYEWGDNATQRRAEQYATNGFWSGMEQVKRSTMANRDAIRAAELADYRAKLRIQEEESYGGGTPSTSTDNNGNTWSEARLLRVKGTGEAVWVKRDENGNETYSTRGEKGSRGRYPHSVISANQVEQKPTTTKPITKKVDKLNQAYVYDGRNGGRFVEKASDARGDGSPIVLSSLSPDHLIDALTVLGIDIKDYETNGKGTTIEERYNIEMLRQIAKEYNSQYTVRERVSSDKHKDSRFDWYSMTPMGGATSTVTEIPEEEVDEDRY